VGGATDVGIFSFGGGSFDLVVFGMSFSMGIRQMLSGLNNGIK
jgi:hypothetical protein